MLSCPRKRAETWESTLRDLPSVETKMEPMKQWPPRTRAFPGGQLPGHDSQLHLRLTVQPPTHPKEFTFLPTLSFRALTEDGSGVEVLGREVVSTDGLSGEIREQGAWGRHLKVNLETCTQQTTGKVALAGYRLRDGFYVIGLRNFAASFSNCKKETNRKIILLEKQNRISKKHTGLKTNWREKKHFPVNSTAL